MNITRITISSNDNREWNGSYSKSEVCEVVPPDIWIDYVLDRVLESECPTFIAEMFKTHSEIKSIELRLLSGTVKISCF